MEWMIFILIILAAYNATAAALDWKELKWAIVMYWICVECYWIWKVAEMG